MQWGQDGWRDGGERRTDVIAADVSFHTAAASIGRCRNRPIWMVFGVVAAAGGWAGFIWGYCNPKKADGWITLPGRTSLKVTNNTQIGGRSDEATG